MNVLFFITPKSEVAYLYEDYSLRQALEKMEHYRYSIKRRWHNEPVNVDCEIEDLILTSMNQNFVPVIDDNKIFIGIIRRKDIIAYCYDRCKEAEKHGGDEVSL